MLKPRESTPFLVCHAFGKKVRPELFVNIGDPATGVSLKKPG
jgi:hypothetical protein